MKTQKRREVSFELIVFVVSQVSFELIVFVVSHSLSPFVTEGKSSAKSKGNGLLSLWALEGNGGSRKASSSCDKQTAAGTEVVGE